MCETSQQGSNPPRDGNVIDRWTKASVIAEGIQAFGVLAVVASLIYAHSSLKAAERALIVAEQTMADDHDRSRRLVALELWNKWREARDSSPTMQMSLTRIEQGEIDETLARRIILPRTQEDAASSDSQATEDAQLKRDCVTMLNLFEQVAAAYKHNIGDRQMIRESFQKPMQRYYAGLGAFTHVWEIKNQSHWNVLQEVIKDWSQAEQPLNQLGTVDKK